VEHSLLKRGELLVAVLVCVAAALDYLEMLLATLKKHWLYFAEVIFALVQARPAMRMTFASQDAVCPHMCSGSRLETYAGTPVVACVLVEGEQVHLSVPPAPMPTAVSVLQVSAIHNLLQVLQTAVSSVINVQAATLAAVMAATSTAAAVFHTCTSSATQEIQDPAMCINLLLLQQVYLLNRVVLLHPSLRKIQNILSGQVQDFMNTCIL
jgi:hypothetical protein